nr:glycosyltransferase family 39 protein [Terriglobales bacterium]
MMNAATGPGVASNAGHASGLVRQLIAGAEKVAASRLWILALFTLFYVVPTVRLTRIKLFWDDEFFTLYLSRIPSWTILLQALATGADQHPPTFYYLTHSITQVLGTSHVTLRVTAIAGFWLLCVCLYEIVRSLTTPLWGVVAMLFPLTTNFYYYATEARGYGLVAGFAGLAVLCWLEVSRSRRRRLYLPLLAFSLAAAVASHYYAGLIVLCLGLGELARTMLQRKIDWAVWTAFGFTGLPV